MLLFGPRRKCLEMGYTKFLITSLQESVHIVYPGCTKVVGGAKCLTPDIVDRCFRRMAAWIRLAEETIRTEAPDFDVLNAFEIFKIKPGIVNSNTWADKNGSPCEQVKMLGRTLNVDPQALLEGYHTLLPVAVQKMSSTPGCVEVEAWRATFEHITKSKKMSTKLEARSFLMGARCIFRSRRRGVLHPCK